jgi:hypothetical protein
MKMTIVVLLSSFFLACAQNDFQSNKSVVSPTEKLDRGERLSGEQDSLADEKERPDSVPAHPTNNSSDLNDDETAQATPPTADRALRALNRRLLKNAEYVVAKEKNIRGVGDACNFFLQRVLDLSGFSDQGYLATDFDRYAKSHFRNQKTATFAVEPLRKDAQPLHTFLFSYPEETPFILQWQRKVGRGHLAIVARKGNDLIIYEASLGRFKAEKKRTTAKTILSASDRYKLSVYVDFMPSDK